jgi:hypothetical protein
MTKGKDKRPGSHTRAMGDVNGVNADTQQEIGAVGGVSHEQSSAHVDASALVGLVAEMSSRLRYV